MLLAVVGVTSAAGWAVTRGGLLDGPGADLASPAAAEPTTSPSVGVAPSASPSASVSASPSASPAGSVSGRGTVAARAPLPAERPRQVPRPGPRLLGPGDAGAAVRELQSRLRQVAWFVGDVTDDYGTATETAVRGFQARRGIAVTGYVDQRTRDRLAAMTREPTRDELANRFPGDGDTSAALDPRCRTGRALCIDKTSRTLRWVVDGKVLRSVSVRFGSSYTPTREGLFSVESKSRDHVSSLYDSPMPFAMFFSGGQAVHYSADFAARGYAGASHGCVNVRDLPGITWLYDQVSVGDKVVVHWS
ncbi:L,D-transpeptidase family protein [Nocardioides aurantiacus]|uniref:Putative peptidoglycan binding protein n=1 Tax=Nocardioides aurantiacus TaxID=86796 RepID=A0A3N2CPR8_9ACTN|nr:L,D-transpeptidase family protein [Nocardioides aurantiacus]ROR89512.1 putative peptidoglycan binding protein [Nocardioides aurantiacus]